MLALNDIDHFNRDNDTDYLIKPELLEPYPFQMDIQTLKDPLSKTLDNRDMTFHKKDAKKPVKRRTWKKPKGKPKRPLSVYNLFFQHEREKLINSCSNVDEGDSNASTEEKHSTTENNTNSAKRRRHRKSHGKIGFAQLARDISQKWKTLDAEALKGFEEKARAEKERYKKELEEWKKKTNNGMITNRNDERESNSTEKTSLSPNVQPNDVLSLLEESSASFRSSNKSDLFTSIATEVIANAGPRSTIPDVPTSWGACTAIDQADLLARISKLNERRLATRKEHRRILDATFALCRPNRPPTAQEPSPSCHTHLVKDESPEQFELFTDTFFDDLDTEPMSM